MTNTKWNWMFVHNDLFEAYLAAVEWIALDDAAQDGGLSEGERATVRNAAADARARMMRLFRSTGDYANFRKCAVGLEEEFLRRASRP